MKIDNNLGQQVTYFSNRTLKKKTYSTTKKTWT